VDGRGGAAPARRRGADAGGGRLAGVRGGEEAWDAARRRLDDAHRQLLDAVAAFPPARLDERVGGERAAALGTGTSYAILLHGAAQHHACHGGQITLLRRALGA
jgi:hypothetical protein